MSFYSALRQAAPIAQKQIKRLLGSQVQAADDRAHVWERPELTHPAVGLTPAKLHQLLTGAESGNMNDMLALFEDMEERDSHIFAELDKRKRSLLSLDWYIKPPEGATAAEKEQATTIQNLMHAINDFDIVIKDALDAIGKGFSGQEINWIRDGSTWYVESLEFVIPQRFVIAPDNKTLMLGNGIDAPEALWDHAFLMHTHKAKSGYLVRGGLHRILAWPYVFKNYSVRDLAEFLEIYGLPMRLGTYPAGATEAEKFTLLRAVMEIGHRAAGIVPQGMQIDFKEAAKGNSDPFESMIKWCELSQSKAILGGTLTTQSDGKSSTNALGNIHEVARIEIRDSDAKQLAASVSRDIVASMMRLNYPSVHPRRYPKFAFDLSEPEDITTFSEAIPKLAGVNGMRIGASWLHSKLNIPMADDDEPILSVGNIATPTALTAALNAHRAALAAKTDPVKREHANIDKAERGIDEATTGDDWDNNITDMSARLGQALVDKLASATSYDEALALLSNAEPNQAVDELAANLEQYLCAAGLWGKLHAQPLELPAGDV
ncbi:DUF935 domain-containing protein [Psychrobacter sp. JB193]|uniref:DUF935 domain-containing protein n=1 Tax=Psychrobacter sp. JB193 TaxID=2024406 RepID=UPI000BAAADF0|nr:DUF935 domain-containing protein [Psychrobacter sp. JB193]PAT63091.1 hypothetical protein CIK80_11100 [Psychrobacter sp. JB193]